MNRTLEENRREYENISHQLFFVVFKTFVLEIILKT